MALAIVAVLAVPIVQMILSSKRKVEGLPRRLCAYYFAQDLMEERLDKRLYRGVRSIRARPLTRYAWIRNNVRRVEASETGQRRGRIARAREFLDDFVAGVDVVEEVPGRRKRITVTVQFGEGGRDELVVLRSVLEN